MTGGGIVTLTPCGRNKGGVWHAQGDGIIPTHCMTATDATDAVVPCVHTLFFSLHVPCAARRACRAAGRNLLGRACASRGQRLSLFVVAPFSTPTEQPHSITPWRRRTCTCRVVFPQCLSTHPRTTVGCTELNSVVPTVLTLLAVLTVQHV